MRRNRLKGFIGIFLMAATVAAMYFWLSYGTDALASREVLIASVDIEEGTLINDENYFTVDKRNSDSLTGGSLTKKDLPLLIGMAAKQYIPKNAQLDIRFFSKPGLVVTGDKVVFKLPPSWIYSVPSSIRRGDEIEIYEIGSDVEAASGELPKSEEGPADYQEKTATKAGQNKPLLASTVLYVKDSANREVVDTGGGKRMDGSSQVSSIEILCTNGEIRALERRAAKGVQFIIVYTGG